MLTLFCGIDFHKNFCTICLLSADGKFKETSNKEPETVIKYLANKKIELITIEASTGVHDFVSKLKSCGHTVKIINPSRFRSVGVGGKKTDKKDAELLAEFAKLNLTPGVHHKSLKARELKSLLVMREFTIQSRVSLSNHIRGVLREFGIPIPAGKDNFCSEGLGAINKIENGFLRNTLIDMFAKFKELLVMENEIDEKLLNMGDVEEKNRYKTIPGVGEIISLTFMATVDDVSRFKNSKHFASYVGLVPREDSSGGKQRMGSITRSGPEMLRRNLIHGARSILKHPLKKEEKDSNIIWAQKLKERIGMNKATVALAHRLARILYVIASNKTTYGEYTPSKNNAA